MQINRFSFLVLFIGFGFVLSGCPATTKSTSDTSTMEDEVPTTEPEMEMVEPMPDTGSDIVETPMMGGGISASDLEDIYFDYDRSVIRSDSRAVLERTASLLKDNPGTNLQIEGHCDERGTNDYNLALGERRAKSIKEFLVALGVSPSRLSTISYGEEKPGCSASSESCYAQNRRGHFVIR